MIINNLNVFVPPENPFENDVLDRREHVETLTKLISTVNQPFVMSISSPWGTGKSTFIRMWAQYLKNQSYYCIYFNAWENQADEDPLITFMAEINNEIILNLDAEHKGAKKIFVDAKKISITILKRAIPAIAKLATYGVLDIGKISEEILANALGKTIEDSIANLQSTKRMLISFKEKLEGFIKELNKHNDPIKPLIFLIDELDRCKPTYVINLLERMNHVFNIPGIIFITVMDRDQINSSIKAIYGEGMDTDGYLRRFINLDYELPKPSNLKYSIYLFNQFGIESIFKNDNSFAQHILIISQITAVIFEPSLRTQEQIFTHISIALRTGIAHRAEFLYFLVILIALKAANKKLYCDFIQHKITAQKIIDFIKSKVANKEIPRNYSMEYFYAIIICSAVHEEETQAITQKYYEMKEAANDTEKKSYGKIYEVVEMLLQKGIYNYLDFIAKKVESLEGFK